MTATEAQTRIDETETAIHKVMMGGRTVELVAPDGSRVRYAEADLPKLQTYLKWLQQQKSQAEQGIGRRPIYIEFGR